MNETDRHVDALRRLCEQHGGHAKVAEKIGANPQSLYQIIAGIKLPSGNPKGVGPTLRKKLDATFPKWLDEPSDLTPSAQEMAVLVSKLTTSGKMQMAEVEALLAMLKAREGGQP